MAETVERIAVRFFATIRCHAVLVHLGYRFLEVAANLLFDEGVSGYV
jgi:hypothetical protein